MTTKVEIDTHAGWAVRVTCLRANGNQSQEVVAPGSKGIFSVWGGMDLRVHEVEPNETQTFGQKAVGLSFNPSALARVDRLKALFAEIIDICDIMRHDPSTSPEKKRLFSVAITEAQGAQMWAVKAETWRDE